jgi:tetratricopeptide (TPR) repeat protein
MAIPVKVGKFLRVLNSLGLLACVFLAVPACIAVDSMAEAYLEHGKRAYDRGDLMAAKRLFNMAAVNAVKTYDSPLHMASIFNNAGEVYRKLYELKGPSYAIDEEDLNTVRLLSSQLTVDPVDLRNKDIGAELMVGWYLKRALEIKEAQLGTFSLDVARSLENLASLYQGTDREDAISRLDEAEALFRKALKIRETKEGSHSMSLGSISFRLGIVLKKRAFKHTDGSAKLVALKEAISYFQRADRIWTGNQSGADLMCAADKEISLANYQVWRENNQVEFLDRAERHYDEATSRYLKNQPRLKKQFEAFKQEGQPLVLDSFVERWRLVRSVKQEDGNLPRGAADELVNLMRAAKRADNMDDYHWAQKQYNKVCGIAKVQKNK